MNKRTFLIAAALTAACTFTSAVSAAETLKVGASPVPHADILKVVQPQLAKKGIDLKIIEFSDYVQPNLALSDKDLDANFFQHLPYLESFAKDHRLSLVSAGAVHIEPMGVYSKKVKKLADLKKGASVAIPNDPTNGGRALQVLDAAGLIKMKAGVGVNGTPLDIVDNPKRIRIVEVEAATLPRALDDLDTAVINSNYALGANLNPTKDAIAMESKDSPYANVVAVRAGEEDKPAIKELMTTLRSPEVKKFIEEKYNGAVVSAF